MAVGDLQQKPQELPSQVARRGVLVPALKNALQHLADTQVVGFVGPSDSVTPRAHQSPSRLIRLSTHHT